MIYGGVVRAVRVGPFPFDDVQSSLARKLVLSQIFCISFETKCLLLSLYNFSEIIEATDLGLFHTISV